MIGYLIRRWCTCRASTDSRGALPPNAVETLRKKLAGRIVLPGDADYDAARKLIDPRFDPHPSVILYCAIEEDVRHCLRALKRFSVPFRIRSGGHSTAGYSACDGAILDVSGLDSVSIDAAEQTAAVGTGCNIQKLNDCLDRHRLHLPLGGASTICMGGFVQGGGYGLTSRTFGMNCDSAVEFRVMLADGRIVRASETINHDLWWALRGGTGGNFGVVLTVQYRLQRPKSLIFWSFSWPLLPESRGDRWERPIAALCTMQRCFTGSRQTAVGVAANIQINWPPPQSSLSILGSFDGTRAEADAALQPLQALTDGAKTIDLVRSSHELSRVLTLERPRELAIATPLSTHRKSRFVSRSLEPDDWRKVLDQLLTSPTPYSEFQIHCYGGEIAAYPRDKSAFIHRTTSFCCYLMACWKDASQQRMAEAYLDDWCSLMEPYWDGGIYQNFPSEDYDQYRSNYWGAAFPTLLKIKQKYDPGGLFAFPQMINSAERAPITCPALVAQALRKEIQDTP